MSIHISMPTYTHIHTCAYMHIPYMGPGPGRVSAHIHMSMDICMDLAMDVSMHISGYIHLLTPS